MFFGSTVFNGTAKNTVFAYARSTSKLPLLAQQISASVGVDIDLYRRLAHADKGEIDSNKNKL